MIRDEQEIYKGILVVKLKFLQGGYFLDDAFHVLVSVVCL